MGILLHRSQEPTKIIKHQKVKGFVLPTGPAARLLLLLVRLCDLGFSHGSTMYGRWRSAQSAQEQQAGAHRLSQSSATPTNGGGLKVSFGNLMGMSSWAWMGWRGYAWMVNGRTS